MKKTLFEILCIITLIGLSIGFLFLYLDYTKAPENIQELSLTCNFEELNNNGAIKTNLEEFVIEDALISTDIAYSGKSSLVIPNWKTYQNLIVLKDVAPNSNVFIKLKRHNSSNAAIAVNGDKGSQLYYSNKIPSSTDKNGWEYLELKFKCPDDFTGNIKIYIYNHSNESTIIDDLEISVSDKPFFPKYEDVEPILLYIEDIELNKLKEKRSEAIKKGVLITENDSWVNAIVYGQNKMMKAEIRLKGDWLDHLKGDKWSFRIKLKDDSWNGMRVFSIQSPDVRGFMNEWILHKTCKDEDILTTRYGFVPVYLNGKSLGLYSYEEHFQKELIESSKRREGPIVKFSEDDFWHFMLNGQPNGFTYITSIIEPFGTNSILNDNVKYEQFLIAANLMSLFRSMKAKASDIFDVKKLAKFIAIANSRNAFHALEWHNIRYYYNPVICRLEPIAFDMFSGSSEFTHENPITPMLGIDQLFNINYSFIYFMTDPEFEEYYFAYLKKYTEDITYQSVKLKYQEEYVYYDSLNNIEFSPYYYDTTQFFTVVHKIDSVIPIFKDSLSKKTYRDRIEAIKDKPFYFHGLLKANIFGDKYLKCYKQNSRSILFRCFLQFDLDILGLGNKEGIQLKLDNNILNENSGEIKDTVFTFNDLIEDYKYVYFRIKDQDTIFKTDIVQWSAPTNYNPRNDIANNATDISQYINHEKQEVHFSGNLSFNNHVYTPIGYSVIIEAGTNIDITNNSAIIINSNVIAYGTSENPIKVFSSDGSANGFTILQAEEKSILKNVYFDNLNTLDYNYWTLTGAVTFYESDVEFYNCKFTNNHCEDMLNTIRCDFYIEDCTIENTYGDSHDSDFCTGTLDNCTFTNNGNDAIDFSTSEVTIQNCFINGAGDKGISVGENTKAIINNVEITKVNIGIASKDLSHAEVNNCTINNANYGFLLLQKKPEFGPATVTAKNCTLTDVWTESLIEKYSTLILNGKTHKGTKSKLKTLFYE